MHERSISPEDQGQAAATEQVRQLVRAAVAHSGLSYEVYADTLSDTMGAVFPEGHPDRSLALQLAGCDYIPAADRKATRTSSDKTGECIHGLAPACCPCGCGDAEQPCLPGACEALPQLYY